MGKEGLKGVLLVLAIATMFSVFGNKDKNTPLMCEKLLPRMVGLSKGMDSNPVVSGHNFLMTNSIYSLSPSAFGCVAKGVRDKTDGKYKFITLYDLGTRSKYYKLARSGHYGQTF